MNKAMIEALMEPVHDAINCSCGPGVPERDAPCNSCAVAIAAEGVIRTLLTHDGGELREIEAAVEQLSFIIGKTIPEQCEQSDALQFAHDDLVKALATTRARLNARRQGDIREARDLANKMHEAKDGEVSFENYACLLDDIADRMEKEGDHV